MAEDKKYHFEDDFVSNGSTDLWQRPSRKSRSGNWKACWLIFGCEVCERVAFYAVSSCLAIYLFEHLHESRAQAATNINNWNGTLFLVSLFGAFVGDALLGRYLTLAVFMCVYLLSVVLLTTSVVLNAGRAFFYSAIYLMAIGGGCIKPNVTSFAGDQFDEKDPSESKRKASYLNWWFVSLSIGMLFSVTVLVKIQVTYGWSWGWGAAASVVAAGTVLFFSGRSIYRIQKPQGSPFTRVAQVLVAAVSKWRVSLPVQDKELYEVTDGSVRRLSRTGEFTFLDKAAVITSRDLTGEDGMPLKPWKLCTVTQVEEVKLLIRIAPIWITNLMFNVIFAQIDTFFLNQGEFMQRKLGSYTVPTASFRLFHTLSVCSVLPFYDRYIVPLMRRLTGKQRGITSLQRIGIGQMVCTVTIAVAAVVEMKRLQVAEAHGLVDVAAKIAVPMSAFWLVPQYALIGLTEVFISVGRNEFFYDQVPDSMRTMGSALYLSTVAVGNFLSGLLVKLVVQFTSFHGNWLNDNLNQGHVDYFYWLLASLSLLNTGSFLVCARWYKYKNPA